MTGFSHIDHSNESTSVYLDPETRLQMTFTNVLVKHLMANKVIVKRLGMVIVEKWRLMVLF